MDISGISSSSFPTATSPAGLPSMAQVQASTDSQILSLLPSASTPGLGGNLDIYAAVGNQNLLNGGLTAVEMASASMGIDLTKSNPAQASQPPVAGTTASTPPQPDLTAQLLQQDGFTYQPNPYAVQTDFFADSGSVNLFA